MLEIAGSKYSDATPHKEADNHDKRQSFNAFEITNQHDEQGYSDGNAIAFLKRTDHDGQEAEKDKLERTRPKCRTFRVALL